MGIQQRPWNDYVEGMEHSPPPWTEDLTPAVKAGSDRVLLAGRAPLRDIRVLTEENFQHARHCVNAHEVLVAALERASKWIAMGGNNDNGTMEQIVAALELARGKEVPNG